MTIPAAPTGVRGWADRVAEQLGAADPGFGYANLAIRGRKLRQILAEQVDAAVELQPTLVSIYAGANDILRPRIDIDDLLGSTTPASANSRHRRHRGDVYRLRRPRLEGFQHHARPHRHLQRAGPRHRR